VKIASLALMALMGISPLPPTAILQAQFGNPEGFDSDNGSDQCTSPSIRPYVQCVHVRGNVRAVYGTLTIKREWIEILVNLSCAADMKGAPVIPIWQGEMRVGQDPRPMTITVDIPNVPPGISGANCWMQYQENQGNKDFQDGGDFEYQLTVYGQGQ
jgi:hypothetical protein